MEFCTTLETSYAFDARKVFILRLAFPVRAREKLKKFVLLNIIDFKISIRSKSVCHRNQFVSSRMEHEFIYPARQNPRYITENRLKNKLNTLNSSHFHAYIMYYHILVPLSGR